MLTSLPRTNTSPVGAAVQPDQRPRDFRPTRADQPEERQHFAGVQAEVHIAESLLMREILHAQTSLAVLGESQFSPPP